jgi:hypothetical protein
MDLTLNPAWKQSQTSERMESNRRFWSLLTITIANCLYFEYTANPGNIIESLVNGLQENKDLGGLASRAPSSEARNIGEQDSCIREKVSNGLCLIKIIVVLIVFVASIDATVGQVALDPILAIIKKAVSYVGWEHSRYERVGLKHCLLHLLVTSVDEVIIHEEDTNKENKSRCYNDSHSNRKIRAVLCLEFGSWVDIKRVETVSLRFQRPFLIFELVEWDDNHEIIILCVVDIFFSPVKRLDDTEYINV